MASKLPTAASDSYSNGIKTGVLPSPDLDPNGPEPVWVAGLNPNTASEYAGLPDNPPSSHTAEKDTVGGYVPLP
jgi:hypothetical protein